MISSLFTGEETELKRLSHLVQLVEKPALKSEAQVPSSKLLKLQLSSLVG